MNQEILDRLFPDLTSNQKYVLDLFIEYCETKLIKVSCENERLTETVEQLGNDAQSLVLEIERLRDENKELKIKVRTMSNVNRLLLLQQQENRQSLGGGCSHGEKVGSKSVEKPSSSSSSSSCHHRRTTTAVSCEKKETPNRIVTRSRAKAKDGSSAKKIVDDKVEAVKKTSSPKTTVQQTKRSTSMGKLVKQPKDKSQPLVKENISFEENKKRGLVSDVTKKRLQADKPKKVSPVVEEKSKKAKISPATGKENKKPKDATCDLKKIIRKRTTTGGLTLRAVNVAESPKIKSDKTGSKASKSLQESLNTTFKVSR
ncbi:uncharacterized protein LOC106652938 isoform X2 [Trichogramma pretiosum]|uniref:uncharacterized protein LOC106652938 isoform X2 n=1 Tax=Trichogramma pretiosum TaxID=7493 RepID=UPI0006C98E35|nr:uncharacterized protein LOC106652938 isoform X2 [Trichogramma pretiosum]